MKQIIYAMQFRGQAAPSSQNSNVLNAATTAASSSLRTVVDAQGVGSNIEPVEGGPAAFESEVTLTGGTGFQESGSIVFGNGGHSLRFSTVGAGYLNTCADEKLKHGTVTWKIDSGEGQFANATGLITSNFTVSDTGAVVDNHFGIIFLQ
jgi:hypothetical protein